jgi:hypothetical protein
MEEEMKMKTKRPEADTCCGKKKDCKEIKESAVKSCPHQDMSGNCCGDDTKCRETPA